MTKREELEIVQQIAALIASAGPDSYIAATFEGCCEMAQTNIENDWMCTYHDRIQAMEEEAAALQARVYEQAQQIADLKARTISADDANACFRMARTFAGEQQRRERDSAAAIVSAADDPNGEAFRQAVANNRNAAKLREEFEAIADRLAKIC